MMTKQADAAKTDINQIMARWIAHGIPPTGAAAHAQYGEFDNVDDYHHALNNLKEADASFGRLPAAIRKHVNNDPGEFLQMVMDPDRRGELEALGLVEAMAPEDAPPAAPAVADPAPSEEPPIAPTS